MSQFETTVLSAIYITWVIKDIVRNTYNIIQESDTHNNNSNIQGSEWLTQYWEESEKEDGPEASSSQEKILKKSKKKVTDAKIQTRCSVQYHKNYTYS